jgi:hypothetical protein
VSLIDVSEVITDPDFCQDFTVYRRSGGRFQSGGFVPGDEAEVPMSGVVIPLSSKELELIPEAERVKGTMGFWTTSENPIYVTRNLTSDKDISDVALWNGERYKILSVDPYSDYGFYHAIGVREVGD